MEAVVTGPDTSDCSGGDTPCQGDEGNGPGVPCDCFGGSGLVEQPGPNCPPVAGPPPPPRRKLVKTQLIAFLTRAQFITPS